MQAIIINNKVTLVDDFSFLKMPLIVPKRNLQRMKELTKCSILSKEPTRVNYNNYAGDLFKVTISVAFKSINPYLNYGNAYEAVNSDNYLDLLNKPRFSLYARQVNLKTDNVNLYAFGDCAIFKIKNNSTIYYSLTGDKRSFINRDLNDFGNKRYIIFKGHIYSNRKF